MVLEHRRQRITLRRGCSAFNLHWHARHRAGAKIVFHRLHTRQGLRCTFGRGLVGRFQPSPRARPEMAVAHGDVDEDRIEFVLVQQNQFVAKFMRFAIERPAVSMSVQRSMPDTDRGRDHRMPDAAGR